jgi:ubiquinone/menaquinone biosynthesis C-methylase UbiE
MQSVFRTVTPSDVQAVYGQASRCLYEWDKVMWGTQDNLDFRAQLVVNQIDWGKIHSWMDVGCGTGYLFEKVEKLGISVEKKIGLDMCKELLQKAQQKNLKSHIEWILASGLEIPSSVPEVQLITMIGVLQLCGSPAEEMLTSISRKLMEGGKLILTTINASSREILEKKYQPPAMFSYYHPDDLRAILVRLGFKSVEIKGFKVENKCFVALEEAQDLFLFASK